ncbi:hypothetical protein HanHA300_Chr01g0036331 [Helianthus annuus]|nr:hypothetical protein HanHA300_Chr01g0036331 [Helianthus annuus]KAJ0784957.1 hypothetical protein HanLR1_Chr01g0037481 [Helianthus annuus]
MLVLCTHNVIPRRGDKMEVRFLKVPVLYMLMHGSPMVPFQFLVLNNIYIGRNSGERKIIPHCRLITALLKLYGTIRAEDKGSYKRFKPFDIQHLGSGWKYKESERYHKLKSDGKRWRALKAGARPLRPGEADEPETSDDEQPYDPYWAHTGNMGQVIEQRRPPTFGNWSEPNQMVFDQQTYMGASMERALKQSYDRQEQCNQAHMYVHQEEMNNRYIDDRHRRMHDAWHAGQPVVADPSLLLYLEDLRR